jgi:plasmid stabilization system protein ParE
MYRYVILPRAIKQLEHEIAYSQRKWGKLHASQYRQEIMQQVRKIAQQPSIYAVKPEFGADVRAVRYKGNHIVYQIDESKKLMLIAGFPSIYTSRDT